MGSRQWAVGSRGTQFVSHVRSALAALVLAWMALTAVGPASLLGPTAYCLLPTASVFADGHLDREAQEIAKLLKCPVCQNLAVADSPSPLAEQMRVSIRERLEAGQSREEILAYFTERYGEEVLLDPPKAGFSQLIWWGTAAILIGGAGAVTYFLHSRLHRRDERLPRAALSESELREYEALLEAELDESPEPRGASHEVARVSWLSPHPNPLPEGERTLGWRKGVLTEGEGTTGRLPSVPEIRDSGLGTRDS